MKGRIIRFVSSFIQHRTFKSLISQIKTDLPKLLGYEKAEVFMFDNIKRNLYCMSIRPETNQPDPTVEKPAFEKEFIIDEKQVVRFPPNMGISGYALKGDAVCFINDFGTKLSTAIGPIIPQTSSSRHKVFSLAQ